MKLVSRRPRHRAGFTLIEMIGVLAIIAILASMLIPRIFSAINEARVTGTAFSYNGLKSAAITYFGKHGRIGGNGGTNFTSTELTNGVSNWDRTYLLPGGFIEKAFESTLAVSANVQVIAAPIAGTSVTASNAAYDLDGTGVLPNNATGRVVLQIVLTGVFEEDARDLNQKLDGTSLGTTSGADLLGRVKYAAASGGLTDVYLYLAHK
jgi:prepilin-type N-terminal cleavage/methylation domain-containing protein